MSTPPDDRERRWIAHSLGELSEEESRELEGELRADPERAAHYQRLVGEVRQWAAEPTPHRPLDIAKLLDEAAREGADVSGSPLPAGRSKSSRVPALAWTLAAAALLVFALSQARFTLQLGEGALHWGAGRGAEPNAEALSALRNQTDALLTQLDITRRRLQEVQWQNHRLEASFQQTAAWLSRQQQIESQTRFQDVKRLVQLTDLDDPTPVLWIAQGGGTGERRFQSKAPGRHEAAASINRPCENNRKGDQENANEHSINPCFGRRLPCARFNEPERPVRRG